MIDIQAFVEDGFVKVERPALRPVADEARMYLWAQLGLSEDDRSGWTEAVKWASDMTGRGPFASLADGPELTEALDAVCGPGTYEPRRVLGNIPVRFPVPPTVDDRGWHIDANTPRPDGTWCVSGRPQTVLVLTLLSEVGPDDAPTRLRRGSHRDSVTVLDEDGMSPFDAGPLLDEASRDRPIAFATGNPGDVYLVHPFTVHAADEHRGVTPRFMAQSPVMLTSPLTPATSAPLACVFERSV
ncbi:phytanoyl-CoA dioxygenase family protein [Gordonia sp. 'Campus']|uniref:phytanoyl-CoA dioxygenase family protein n=1 Tax=Gordonia sp. 'Campus' TaxID=2915824 RepID=UPI001EE3EB73|nr:phytanoyl-CoA dioxygenase family protein [Gordonia sp. 'Campus']